MSINILDSDIIEKMSLVEGSAWKREQERCMKSFDTDCSVYGAIERYKEFQSYDEERKSYGVHFTIYGMGGWNRYYLREDGSVMFSKHHASTSNNSIEIALTVGFDIFE